MKGDNWLKFYSESNVNKVREAFENSDYLWRTYEGISRETDIPENDVRGIINALGEYGEVCKSGRTYKNKSIYSLRTRWKKEEHWVNRLLSFTSGRFI